MAVPAEKAPSTAIVKPNSRGTVTIPREFRAAWEGENTVLEVALRDDGVIELRPRVLVDPAWLASFTEWESRREAFFDFLEATAQRANVPPDEAEELAAEAVRAARNGAAR